MRFLMLAALAAPVMAFADGFRATALAVHDAYFSGSNVVVAVSDAGVRFGRCEQIQFTQSCLDAAGIDQRRIVHLIWSAPYAPLGSLLTGDEIVRPAVPSPEDGCLINRREVCLRAISSL